MPVTTLAGITGLPVLPLSGMVGRLCAIVSMIIPAYLVVVMVAMLFAYVFPGLVPVLPPKR
jgi:L-lactate permease